jgi:xanthine dehydrogenase accessory factor
MSSAMSEGLEFFKIVVRWLEEGVPCALATVVRTEGSVPRQAGARMLVRADGSTVGTVGGGSLERAVVEQAQRAMTEGAQRALSYKLASDLGMACGGGAEVLVELLLPPERLYLFGGGHVGLALFGVARQLGFAVTVIDARPEFVSPDRFPGAAGFVSSYDPAAWGDLTFDRRTYCVVATADHRTDFEVVRALFEIEPGPRYIGMIGSKTKRRSAERQLAESGVAAQRIAELRTPMGLSIGAETPEEIAVSIAAELVQTRRTPTEE